mgnify:CR=1 FL=1
MYKPILFFFVILITLSCKSTASVAEINQLKSVIAAKKFELEFTNAVPVAFVNVTGIEQLLPPGSTRANINLVNNPNHFKMNGEEVDLLLPFYGEQQINKGYSTNYSGFEYKGPYQKYTEKYNKRKQEYTLNYWLNTTDENVRAVLTLFPNQKCILIISSSTRISITYYGNWQSML